jgi:ribA/ribD-fused uncharacterized protein
MSHPPDIVQESRRADRVYRRTEAAVFLKTREGWGGLSNMAGGYPLLVSGVAIRSSEALYQACRFPHLPDVQRLIIEQRSPMTAKMKSKVYRSQSRPDWNSVRVPIMRWCLRVKLAQNWDTFGRLLLATGETQIVEESRKDDYWGAKPREEGTLVGCNILGRLLMELRKELSAETAAALRTVEPPAISTLLLFGKPIERIGAAGSESGAVYARKHAGEGFVSEPAAALQLDRQSLAAIQGSEQATHLPLTNTPSGRRRRKTSQLPLFEVDRQPPKRTPRTRSVRAKKPRP